MTNGTVARAATLSAALLLLANIIPATVAKTTKAAPAQRSPSAQTLSLASSVAQTPLLELYTSEGCSSCPPADRWLSGLQTNGSLWSDFVPVAFHVTYWNDLGWPDRFAQPAFDQRQRARARNAGAGVYTPGVFLQGSEWRNWRAHPHVPERADRPIVGTLKAEILCSDVRVHFASAAANPKQVPVQVELAWLQTNQRTKVRRGENRGRTLKHDFVVRSHSVWPLTAGSRDQQSPTWQAQFGEQCIHADQADAVAVWVSDAQGRPVQAVGGMLPTG